MTENEESKGLSVSPAGDEAERTWHCYGAVSGGKYLGEVTAKTQEEALALAEHLDSCNIGLCHQCSGEVEDPMVVEINVEAAQ